MPFSIVRNDISHMRADAIVNTANPDPVIGFGVDSALHQKAGPGLLLARQKIGPMTPGCAAITPAFDLPAKYVIHTVAPVWNGGSHGEESQLQSCYENALGLALEHGCHSVAFPLIATGHYGFPKDKALQIAISVFSQFLLEQEMQIYLVVFDRTSFQLSKQRFQSVASYIDQNYVDTWEMVARDLESDGGRPTHRRGALAQPYTALETKGSYIPMAMPKAASLEEMLRREDAGFSETLLNLIDKSGKKDSEIYKKALLTKQHFSKIRNNPNYKPTKPTAIALALALELDLEATKDLIGRAGYALTNSSKFDLIIRYFIENRMYNVVEINCVLFDHDQSLLGS